MLKVYFDTFWLLYTLIKLVSLCRFSLFLFAFPISSSLFAVAVDEFVFSRTLYKSNNNVIFHFLEGYLAASPQEYHLQIHLSVVLHALRVYSILLLISIP